MMINDQFMERGTQLLREVDRIYSEYKTDVHDYMGVELPREMLTIALEKLVSEQIRPLLNELDSEEEG